MKSTVSCLTVVHVIIERDKLTRTK